MESAGLMELSCSRLQNLKPVFSVAPAAARAAKKRASCEALGNDCPRQNLTVLMTALKSLRPPLAHFCFFSSNFFFSSRREANGQSAGSKARSSTLVYAGMSADATRKLKC